MQRERNCICQAGKGQNSEFQLLVLLVSIRFILVFHLCKVAWFKLWIVSISEEEPLETKSGGMEEKENGESRHYMNQSSELLLMYESNH